MKSMLPAAWKVPELFRSRMGESVGRQRAMESQGHLLLVLHAPPEPDEDRRQGRFFWREPDGSWKSSGQGSGIAALKTHLAEFAARLDALDEQLQHAAAARDYYQLLQAIGPLHRAIRNLHATLQQARELLPADRDLINLRDYAGELERTVELLHHDIDNGLEFTAAREAEEHSRRAYEMSVSAHRLNILAAVFFPIATISTIFGMNLSHGLEAWSGPTAFWGVLAAGLFMGMLLTALIVQRPKPPKPKPKLRAKSSYG
jgi:Mg2+ and Co2+ transporter CorA